MKDEIPGRRTLRIDSIDLLRGIVMVIMMLDHTRDYVHYGALSLNPLDLTQTNTLLFLTRWITHYCAPTFVFLAGTGAYLQFARGKSKSELSRFLISRGLWLIVLEFTVVRLGALFNVDPGFLGMPQVIWVIGVSMIVLAALVHLPLKVTAGFGLAMIFLHNLLDKYQVLGMRPGSPVPSPGARLWMVLHQPGLFPIAGSGSPIVLVLYPLIPWIGVMAVGYAIGALYQKKVSSRRRLLLIIGGLATALFVIIRAVDRYGEPLKWSRQKNLVFTVLSFVNTTKYPPSLLFLLMTLGPAILALAWFESRNGSPRPPDVCFAKDTRQSPELFRHLRSRAAFLLPVAMAHSSHDFDRAAPYVRQAIRVAVSDADRLVHRSAPGNRLQPRGCLRLLDRGSDVALPVVQMVRRSEAAKT